MTISSVLSYYLWIAPHMLLAILVFVMVRRLMIARLPDLDRKQIVVVPAASANIAADRSTQLWLIPAGRAPMSVGVFKPGAVTVLPLSATLLAQLGPTAALAVSVEPAGGSPTGQPTGPVIAKGAISAAQGA